METHLHPGLAWKHYHRASLIIFDLNMDMAPDVKTSLDIVTLRATCPIVVISGSDDLDEKLERTVASEWARKPVNLDTLVRLVLKWSGKTQRHAGPFAQRA